MPDLAKSRATLCDEMTTEYPDITDWGRIPPDRRGRWGRWLYAQRMRHGEMTQAVLRETLAKMGHPLSAPYYSDFEGGRAVPNAEWQAVFRRLWDAEPEPEPTAPEPATSDLAALVAALTEQAEANRQLAAAVADLARSMASPGFLTHAAADGMTTTVLGAIENVRGILLSLDPGRAGTPRRGRRQVSPHGTPASSSPARSAPAGEAPPQ